jgi:hypothetical protein
LNDKVEMYHLKKSAHFNHIILFSHH